MEPTRTDEKNPSEIEPLNKADVCISSNRSVIKLFRNLVKWPFVFVAYTMVIISVIRKYAVENVPEVF